MNIEEEQSVRSRGGGRPPKFDEPSKPVTVTLPERTLEQLTGIDEDRARAIVKAADTMIGGTKHHPAIDVVEVAPGAGIILVRPSEYLKKIPFLRLIEIAPRRCLLVIPSGTDPDSLEIALVDLLDSMPKGEAEERAMVTNLQLLLSKFRRGRKVSKAEILFIDTNR